MIQAPPAATWSVRRESTPLVVLGLATGSFMVLFGYLSIRNVQSFAQHAFDLAIFDQGMWLLSRFQDPFSTIIGLPLFADHSSYILVLLVPLYWLWADPRVLVLVTVAALAAGAPITYALCRTLGAARVLSLVTALAYLLHPVATWNIWEGFHPEVLVIPLLLAAFLLIVRDRPWWGLALVLISLLAKEDVGLVVVPLGIYIAWVLGKKKVGTAMIVAGTAAFVFNVMVLLPALSTTGELIHTERYTHLGDGVFGIVAGIFTQPSLVAGELFGESALLYMAILVLPLPLSLLAPRLLLTGVPFLMVNLLSNSPFQNDFRYHYTSYLFVVVVLAAATGAGWVAGRPQRQRLGGATLTVVMAVAWHLALGPNPVTNTDAWGVDAVLSEQFGGAVALVPAGDTISAWESSVLSLSHRHGIYLFPNPFRDLSYGTASDFPPDPAVVQWVLVRLDQHPALQPDVAEVLDSPDFETVYQAGPVVLLRRRG